jgi:hypothetical protein|tara:strand:+ start:891 stop:1289 length:399 start_codon:yes stop_codon:yes gene_type:complete
MKTDDPQSVMVAQVISLSISQHDVTMAAQQGMLQSSSRGMNGATVSPVNKAIKPTDVIFFNIVYSLTMYTKIHYLFVGLFVPIGYLEQQQSFLQQLQGFPFSRLAQEHSPLQNLHSLSQQVLLSLLIIFFKV